MVDDDELPLSLLVLMFVVSLGGFWLPLLYFVIGYFHGNP